MINFGLITTGLPAPIPDFMRKKRKSKCASPVIPSDSDSDEEWKPSKVKAKGSVFEFIHSSRLIRRMESKLFAKNWRLDQRLNHYTRMFSLLVCGCNWILFMHGCFCPIYLIHVIG